MDSIAMERVIECAAFAVWVDRGIAFDHLDRNTRVAILMGQACEYLSGRAQHRHLPAILLRDKQIHGVNPAEVTGYDLLNILATFRGVFSDTDQFDLRAYASKVHDQIVAQDNGKQPSWPNPATAWPRFVPT